MEYGRYSAPNSQYALVNIPTNNYHSNVNNIYNPNEYKYDTNTVPSFENNINIYGFNTPQEILPYSQKTAEVSPNNYYNFDSYNNINNINNEYNSTSPYEQYFPSSNNLNYDYNFNYQNYDYKNIFNENSYQNPNSNITDNNNNSNNNNNNNNNIIDNTNNNIINNSSNQQTTNNTINLTDFLARLPKNYFFFTKGLYNIGSTCYMNSTLQCLFHVSPLISYFLIVYPKDFKSLKKINESVNTQGNLSYAFYDVIKSIFNASKSKQNLSSFSSPTDIITSFDNAISPEKFQKILGKCNPQFKDLEANDSKDLILYLLQTMHQELNYYTKNKPLNKYPNQYNRADTYMTFIKSFDITNYSIISYLFYGTSENTTKCDNCKNIIYNFQKFEFLSFGVAKYDGKEFNIMNGFDDYIKIEKLTGDNQYYCNYCKKLCDADIQSKIIFPPKYLLINIDYGKNKKFMPSSVKYSEEIDITKYINFDFKKQIKYRILGVCSHLGVSGISGHYISFCKNKKTGKWYNFNDSIVSICNSISEIINYGNPYLLLYEQI